MLAVHVHHHDGDLHRLTVAGTSIDATPSHPFWVVAGKELFARPPPSHCDATEPAGRMPGRWVDAKEVRKGDAVLLAGGVVAEVTDASLRPGTGPVYNLTVDGVHNFAAGNAGALVHNGGGKKGKHGPRGFFDRDDAEPPIRASVKKRLKMKDPSSRDPHKRIEGRKPDLDLIDRVSEKYKLSNRQRDMLHDDVSHRGLSADEIDKAAKAIRDTTSSRYI